MKLCYEEHSALRTTESIHFVMTSVRSGLAGLPGLPGLGWIRSLSHCHTVTLSHCHTVTTYVLKTKQVSGHQELIWQRRRPAAPPSPSPAPAQPRAHTALYGASGGLTMLELQSCDAMSLLVLFYCCRLQTAADCLQWRQCLVRESWQYRLAGSSCDCDWL